MASVINTNIMATRTHGFYSRNNEYMNTAMTRVATGMKVNSAKDNGSVWAISEKLRERMRANDQANQNVQNDIAMLKVIEGGVGNQIEILKTLKERAVNAANDSNVNQDRGIIQTEINQLIAQLDDNSTKVKFNGRTLLDGSGTDSTTASVAAADTDTDTDTDTQPVHTVTGIEGTFSDDSNTGAASTFESLKVNGTTSIDGGISSSATLAINVNGTDVWTATDDKKRGTTLQNVIDAINNADLGVKAQLLTAAGTLTDSQGNTVKAADGTTDYQAAAGLYFVGDDGTQAEVSITSSDNKITFSTTAVTGLYDGTTSQTDTTEYTYTSYTLTNGDAVTDTDILDLVDAANVTQNSATAGSPTHGNQVNLSLISDLFGDEDGNAAAGTLTYDDGVTSGTAHAGAAGWYNDTGADITVYTREKASSGSTLNFHIGGESDFYMPFTLEDMGATALGVNGIDVTTVTGARSAIGTIDGALQKALTYQTTLGSFETRLGYTSDNLVTMNENLEAADSAYRDSDIAKEMTNYMKYAVLSQASQYMLAQAGQNAYQVLNLLQQ